MFLAVVVWLAVLQLPDGHLHVAFLDVGQGDAILITTPNGRQILVDGGPSPTSLTSALGKEMPFWDHSLDLVVMTHADADHIAGLTEVLERYRVAAWLDNGIPDSSPLYTKCIELLQRAGVPRYAAQTGESLALGEGLVLEVLHPPLREAATSTSDSNDDSVVLRLAWSGFAFVLTGDIEADSEHLLLQAGQPLKADVLKVAHHGSAGSSTSEFLGAVDPRFAVISVGADNRAGHPAPAMLDRLAQLGDVAILRTDQHGTIEFVTDQQRLWLRTER
jgi:competence protein ComEC